MKKGKRLFAGIMIAGMLAVMGISAFAQEASTIAEGVQPKGAQCEYCGESGVVIVDTKIGEWVVIDQVPCNWEGADPWDYDDLEERQILQTLECRNCGRGFNNTTKETRRVHNHHSR